MPMFMAPRPWNGDGGESRVAKRREGMVMLTQTMRQSLCLLAGLAQKEGRSRPRSGRMLL